MKSRAGRRAVSIPAPLVEGVSHPVAPWSQMAMTTRYQHLAPELIEGIAGQVADLLWKTD